MNINKIVELSTEERDALSILIKGNSTGVVVLQKVLHLKLEQLRDIRNIDPKGNMGLQALASQTAHAALEDFFEDVFPGTFPERIKKDAQMNPYR